MSAISMARYPIGVDGRSETDAALGVRFVAIVTMLHNTIKKSLVRSSNRAGERPFNLEDPGENPQEIGWSAATTFIVWV